MPLHSHNSWKTLSLRSYTIALAVLGALLAFVVLNRWAFTSLGLESFGRVWQLYVSYSDVGFLKRAFIGTFFTITGINQLFDNEYRFAVVAHHVGIAILATLIACFILKHRIADRWLIASVLLSPALIIQSGYITGALDVYVMIFAVFNIFFTRNIFVFAMILVIGIFTHELFLFTIPAQFFALAVRMQLDLRAWRTLLPLLLPAVIGIAALGVIFRFGCTTIGQDAFEQMMLMKLPHAGYKHGLWSGYYEVTQGVHDNLQSARMMLKQLSVHLLYIALPLLYVALVVLRAIQASSDRIVKWLLTFASLIPLTTYVIATDFYRWVGMSANVALLLTLVLAAQKPTRFPARLQWLITAFVMVAPFGSATMDRPFPMHQFVLEKLGWVSSVDYKE